MASFRFLDLPAEMRNEVYEMALLHDRSTGLLASTALLRTNCQIYQEAKGILYAQSAFTINARFLLKQSPPGQRDLESHLKTNITGDLKAEQIEGVQSVVDCMHSLPPKMLELPTIKIQLQVGDEKTTNAWPPPFRVYRAAARFLYALVMFLNADGVQRNVEISVSANLHIQPTYLVERLLWPIQLLSPQIDLKVTGLDSTEQADLDGRLSERLAKPRRLRDPVEDLDAAETMVAALKSGHPATREPKLVEHADAALERARDHLESVIGVWDQFRESNARYNVAVVHAIFTFLASKNQPDWEQRCHRALDTAYQIVRVASREILLPMGIIIDLMPKQLGAICRRVDWSPPEEDPK